jgi:hypothetical protein
MATLPSTIVIDGITIDLTQFEALIPVYLPVLQTMTQAWLQDLVGLLNAGNLLAARERLESVMTIQQLEQEKIALDTDLYNAAFSGNANYVSIQTLITQALNLIINVIISIGSSVLTPKK